VQSFSEGLYILATSTLFLAPKGADPTVNPTRLRELGQVGNTGPETAASLEQMSRFSGIGGIPQSSPAPLLLLNGWTDELVAPSQALRTYERVRRTAGPSAQISLQLGDIGHGRGANKPNEYAVFNQQASDFFDVHLRGGGKLPAPGSVLAFTQTCPKTRPAGGPIVASDWRSLHPGAVRFGAKRAQTVDSRGGNQFIAAQLDPNFGPPTKPCTTVSSARSDGTAVYQRRVASPFTLLGLPTIKARIRTRGATGELAARLWDVSGRSQVLVSRGIYRLTRNQRGSLLFQLNGNGWRFRRGHRVKLELLGRDGPTYRPAKGRFSVRVSDLSLELPVRERPSRRRGIVAPQLAR
jgi:hypothetical protein